MATTIRVMQKVDLAIADQIFRLAFGSFIGLPDPQDFARTINYMNRWYLDPSAAFVAEENGQIIGSNIVANWGSFGGFGPLTVHPDYWNQKVGQQLVSAAMDYFAKHQMSQLGIFTFSNSPKHLALYERFGFHPRCLTAVMSKPVQAHASQVQPVLKYSELPAETQAAYLKRCAELTDAVFQGLNLSNEICTVAARQWGDTLLLKSPVSSSSGDNQPLEGLAICHCGEGTEAGKETCYVKFGAVRPGDRAAQSFTALLQACEALAAQRGLSTLVCGVNTERQGAYQLLKSLGFRIDILGVAMLCPNQPAFNHPGAFVLDDWR